MEGENKMTKKRDKQRANRRKYARKDRLDKKTIANVIDMTPYYAVYNITLNPRKEEPKYI